MKITEVLIAELSNALIDFQKAEGISNETMTEILEECVQMWKRREILRKLEKEGGKV
jgi:hypothetical protein